MKFLTSALSKRCQLAVLLAISCGLGTGSMQAATPYLMSSGDYSEGFGDIANWANDFASGIGASPWASYPITAGGSANDGIRTTKSSATFVSTTAGGIQKGTGNLVFLSTGSGATSEAVAVDLLLNFTGRAAGTLSFDWAAVDNASGTRPTSLRVFWSTNGTAFTEIAAAQVLDVQSVNSGTISAVALPAAFNNSATARLRFYNHAGTVTGAGNRDKISIDNIAVTSTSTCTTPTSFSVTNSGSFCAGGSGIPLGIDGSQTGVNYQLFRDATNSIGAFVSGTGSAISFGNQTIAGAYTVIATNTTGGCTATMTGSAIVTVNPVVTPAVSVSASPGTTVCNLAPQIIFTASPTNGGGAPTYEWFTNGITTGITTAKYTNATPANGDLVYVVLTSSATCTTQPTANSLTNAITVTTSVAPGVGLAVSPAGAVCPGTPVVFIATPTNGGTPTYEWFTNGVTTTATTAAYTNSALLNGDQVYVVLTSSDPCASPAIVNSITNVASILANTTPAVSIAADKGAIICAGTPVIFTATPVNGGLAPSYQWRSNSIAVGVNSPTYTNATLATGSSITCTLVPSAEVCASPGSATSSPIVMTVNAILTPTVTVAANPAGAICNGSTVTFTATPVNGGLTPAFQWRKNAVAVSGETNVTFTTSSLVSGDVISVVLTPSSDVCVSPATTNSSNLTIAVTAFQLVQATALSENMGVGQTGANISLATYSGTNGWQSTSPITFTSTTTLNPDVRVTTASTGYPGASGGGNVFFSSTTGPRNLVISGINTLGMVAPQLQFGLKADTIVSGDPFVVEVSTDGVTYSPLTITQPNATTAWNLIVASGTIPNASNLRLRFSKNTTASFRLDDIKLRDIAAAAAITPSGPTTFCAGGSVTLTATAGGASYVWSTGATTPSILVTTSAVYSVTIFDANGCSATANQTVTVHPLPVVAVDPAITNVECASSVTFTANAAGSVTYQWFDTLTNAIPDATNATLSLANVHAAVAGNYTVVVTSPTSCTASAVASLSVVDTLAPGITVLGANPVTNECHVAYLDAGATALDACVGSVTVTTNNTVNADAPGVYTVTYVSTDGNGNTNSATRTVYVVDTTAPLVTVLGANPYTNECHATYVDAGATAADSCAGSVAVTTNSTVNADAPGVYTVTYVSTDGNGNTNSTTRTVYVVDTTAPVLTVLGANPATNECHATYVDAGATAADSCAGSVAVTTNSTVNADAPGVYIVTYVSTDGNGNTNSATRTVYVVDTTAPLVTVLGANPYTNYTFVPFLDPGATVTDVCDASATLTTNGTVDVSVPGTYTLSYVGTDAAGNSATNTRVVEVIALVAPTITSEQFVGTAFEVTFTGPSGQSYKLLTTTDLTLPLVNWSVLATGVFNGSPVVYPDATATNDLSRFYRVSSP